VTAAEQYIEDVCAGRITTSKWVRLTCERHAADLKDGHLRGLRFSERKAQRVLSFFERFIPQTDDTNAGQPLHLLPFQQALLWIFYGWEWEATGFRRFKIAYLELARGNGKSALLSGLACMELFTGPPATEVYSVSTDKDTARLVWKTSVDMIELSAPLKGAATVLRSNVHIRSRNAKFEPLCSRDRNIQGKRPSFVVVDELHAHPTRDVWDAMVNALGKRDESRLIALTTAGYDRNSICWTNREYSIKVLQGIIPDDSWFSFIACLDDDDNWQDESKWIKANPALGHMVRLTDLREQAQLASSSPASLNAFLRFRMNVWTDSVASFLPMADWDKCDEVIDIDSLKGQACYGGLDLSSTSDISAFVLLFPPYGARANWVVLPHFFLPEENIKERVRSDRVPYDVWKRQGLFNLTPGNFIDTSFIREKIKLLSDEFDIREIGVDRAFSVELTPQLTADGHTVVIVNQGDLEMTGPCNKLLEFVVKHQLIHQRNPVLRWMASNLVVRVGATGLLKPDKQRATEKIDGMSATLDAISRAMLHHHTPAPSAGFLFFA